MVSWENIDTVMLDMDGTLLDLHFDNHFWREHVPRRYAEKHGLSVETAKDELFPRFQRAEGSLNWYCVDYWTRELGLDIVGLKAEVEHLIAIHPHVLDFLSAVRRHGKHLALVTNAHGKTLALKLERTQIKQHFDSVFCSHDLGVPKEHHEFWGRLAGRLDFDRSTSLLVDDSLPVLRSARQYGIAQLLAIKRPDSKGPSKDSGEFPAIESFRDILPP